MKFRIKKTNIKNLNIKKEYIKIYPTDELGKEINGGISFLDLLLLMAENKHGDFYDIIGVEDSVIRERIFEMMANTFGLDYEDIYQFWLDCD